MTYFFAELAVLKHLIENRHVCLFLDYDGTLTPIVQKPEYAVLPAETRGLLKTLSKNDRCDLTVISGRALTDIKKKVGLKNITYIGNHGMEIEGPDLNSRFPLPPGYKNDLKQLYAILHQSLLGIDGVIIEDKGCSLSIHYRLVDPKIFPLMKRNFEEAVSTYVQKKRITVRDGKMVFEVRSPLDWDKGKAVLWLLEKKCTSRQTETTLPIYIGDDLTDEDAFAALKDKGLTIVVGQPEKSCAQYFLNDMAEVAEFLRLTLNLIQD
jgi:trehalose 6-phosphate phosphatase